MALYSIIVTAYNIENYILEALESVCKQTFGDYEVIVIDDCSQDNTELIINQFVKNKEKFSMYRNETNLGTVYSRNKGIDIAKGKYICILDGDDIWYPAKLEKQAYVLKEKSIDVCFTSYEFIDTESKIYGKEYIIPYEDCDYDWLLRENYIGCSTVAVKSEIIKQNKFSNKFAHEDYYLWLSLIKQGFIFKGVKETLVKYRVAKGSRSNNKLKSAINRYKIYRHGERISVLKSFLLMCVYIIKSIEKRLG